MRHRKSNWRGIFCWVWGHEYWLVAHPLTSHRHVVCLRCYGGGDVEVRDV